MEKDKRILKVKCDYEDILRDSINWYNATYKTDFAFVDYIKDEVNFAIIEFSNANFNKVFDLGRIYGGSAEAFDQKNANLLKKL